ncbi:hypothetical protein M8J75_007344 [Diaphorina citri]|nr:hypothetical protein M8J75_007344 [Diaphorina citri]
MKPPIRRSFRFLCWNCVSHVVRLRPLVRDVYSAGPFGANSKNEEPRSPLVTKFLLVLTVPEFSTRNDEEAANNRQESIRCHDVSLLAEENDKGKREKMTKKTGR